LIHAVFRLLDEVDEDPVHPCVPSDTFIAESIVKLKTDPAFCSKGEEIRDQIMKQPELAAFLSDLWVQLRSWLGLDLNSPQFSIRARIVAATLGLGEKLREDKETKSWINERILAAAVPQCEKDRERIGKFISDRCAISIDHRARLALTTLRQSAARTSDGRFLAPGAVALPRQFGS
jgi:uncharacterized membrane-anchored protein YjiN (DUF445 family)